MSATSRQMLLIGISMLLAASSAYGFDNLPESGKAGPAQVTRPCMPSNHYRVLPDSVTEGVSSGVTLESILENPEKY